ncbi:hypothetical protein SOM46_06900 [Pseudomonas fluorescens]|uniref:hypothetical protein n=1 Tax=Pseudomonas fluorescens TaxID=294 RepID=UPI0017818DD4|nr:hypothetical protein [Pseudomonas fluorescens]MBD8238127.1 hypothetical protein [Pseudomonas fluorescens]MDY0894687.1 hypothetical protein [Pseudomonas fluorescens]
MKATTCLAISMLHVSLLNAEQINEDSKVTAQEFFFTKKIASNFLWTGHYFKKSELCTSPNDGVDCSEQFVDELRIEKKYLGYLVRLHSTQANQSVCSFEFYMIPKDGKLIHNTQFGPIFLQKDADSLEIFSKGIDPTALGLGVCGVHADIDGLKFPLPIKSKAGFE